MVKIDSPLGSTKIQDGSPQKIYTVDDPTAHVSHTQTPEQPHYNRIVDTHPAYNASKRPLNTPQEIQEEFDIRKLQALRQEKNIISDEKRKRAEFLMGIGRDTKDVECGGVKFSLQTLKSSEMREATIYSAQKESAFIFELRIQKLARAIYAINDLTIKQITDSDDINTFASLIDSWDENLVSFLETEFSNLTKNAKKKFNLSTNQEVKEAIEDIKKS